jgi:hypothetical protein
MRAALRVAKAQHQVLALPGGTEQMIEQVQAFFDVFGIDATVQAGTAPVAGEGKPDAIQ